MVGFSGYTAGDTAEAPHKRQLVLGCKRGAKITDGDPRTMKLLVASVGMKVQVIDGAVMLYDRPLFDPLSPYLLGHQSPGQKRSITGTGQRSHRTGVE